MSACNTWIGYLKCCARIVQDQIVLARGHKQRKRAIAKLYPLPPDESNRYRRRSWTRACREQIAMHHLRKRPGAFRLRSK